jgi:hypothetical protein
MMPFQCSEESQSLYNLIICGILLSAHNTPHRNLRLHQETQVPIYAVSLFPSLTSFNAFIVPWRACLWFLRNFGSVPLREGYRWVFGFLILYIEHCVSICVYRGSAKSLITVFNDRAQKSIVAVRNWLAYPFLCAFLAWLC